MQADTQMFTSQNGAVWLDYPVPLTTLNYSKPENLLFTTQLLLTAIVHFFSPRNILFLELSSTSCTNHELDREFRVGKAQYKCWAVTSLTKFLNTFFSFSFSLSFSSQGVVLKMAFSHNHYKKLLFNIPR